MVQNINHAKGRYIAIHFNSGKHWVTKEANIKGYGPVWFDKGSISNILSFIRIREKYPACYGTEGGYCSLMKPDKEVLFRQSILGLYFHNNYDRDEVLINTVLEIKEGLYQKIYNGAN